MLVTRLHTSIGLCQTIIKSASLKRKWFLLPYKTSIKNVVCQSSTGYYGSNTIFALSSGTGKAGVAVIRISGDKSAQVVHRIARMDSLPEPRECLLRKLFDPETEDFLDRGPRSFTGEDCCELHIHGGLAVTSAILSALYKLPNFVQAEPGEFTKRAFLNGKLDLTAVEGMVDLINAETEAQRKQALRQMDGELCKLYSGWRHTILQAVAHVEAFIDFGDDEIIEEEVLVRVDIQMKDLLDAIEHHLRDNRRGERLRGGAHVAILGSPNVGKSSLLNFLGQKPAAIVSPIAGTTRDVIEIAANIGGYPVLICDTAGLHQSNDLLEKEGIHRAIKKARESDLVILMLDSTRIEHENGSDVQTLIAKSLCAWGLTDLLGGETLQPDTGESDSVHSAPKIIVAVNKIDICAIANAELGQPLDIEVAKISCLTGEGMDNFLETLTSALKSLCEDSTGGHPNLTQVRHRDHLMKCVRCLTLYLERRNQDLALATHELHRATRQLGEISGEITTEQILDVIFREFCIGK